MLEVEGLSFGYGSRPVLSNITFSAEVGECVALLGNNGAGKSTLVTCLNRIRRPAAGKVLLDGRDTALMGRLELARQAAYLPQKCEPGRTTVFDTVLLGRKPYMRWGAEREDLERCGEILAQLGLEPLSLRYTDELSGGELQKAMLARALVGEPKLLLLDEPTSNLDPKNQYEMMGLVKKFAKERRFTVLIVLHDLNLALFGCSRFLFLKGGSVYRCCRLEEVNGEIISGVYGVPASVETLNGRKIVMIGEDRNEP